MVPVIDNWFLDHPILGSVSLERNIVMTAKKLLYILVKVLVILQSKVIL